MLDYNNPELMHSLEGALNGAPRRWEWAEEEQPPAEESFSSDGGSSDDDSEMEPTTFVQVNGEILRTQRSVDARSRNESTRHTAATPATPHPLLAWLEARAGILLLPVLPLLWCGLLVSTMDRDSVLSAWAMPLLGIASASLANAVPVGGGIVFVPALQIFGVEPKLGAAFAVATMTVGNGVVGFLSWLQKDPSAIAWRIVPHALFPAWAGATMATLRPVLAPSRCQELFAGFCLVVAAVVARGLAMHQRHPNGAFSIAAGDKALAAPQASLRQSGVACACSFLAGSVLVAHIGIGNAMTTFLVASLVWRLPAKACVVTGILVGGWTSAVPFGLHGLVLRDVPIALWVMGLPGVYLGARIAPVVHERVGLPTILAAFCVFLVATAGLMLHAAVAAP